MAAVRKGYLPTIIIVVLAHLLLLALIYSHKIVLPRAKPKTEAIKSYLYIKPQPVAQKQAEEIVEIANEITKEVTKEITEQKPTKPPLPTGKNIITEQVDNNEQTTETPKKITNNLPAISSAKQVSAQALLHQLRAKLNSHISKQQSIEFSQHRSSSIMHAQPALVPHSSKIISPEQQAQSNTNRLSNDISITKRADGTCSIAQDLTNVGMEGITAHSSFSCGESAFDKSFREHMEEVSRKLK